jgi:hypothetical protein
MAQEEMMARGKRTPAATKAKPERKKVEKNAADVASLAFRKIQRWDARAQVVTAAIELKKRNIEEALDADAARILRTLQGEVFEG